MTKNSKQYEEGDSYKVYDRKGSKYLVTITIPESMCKAGLDRMLFFKHNIPPGDYSVRKVLKDE